MVFFSLNKSSQPRNPTKYAVKPQSALHNSSQQPFHNQSRLHFSGGACVATSWHRRWSHGSRTPQHSGACSAICYAASSCGARCSCVTDDRASQSEYQNVTTSRSHATTTYVMTPTPPKKWNRNWQQKRCYNKLYRAPRGLVAYPTEYRSRWPLLKEKMKNKNIPVSTPLIHKTTMRMPGL